MKKPKIAVSETLLEKNADQSLNLHSYFSTILPKYFEIQAIPTSIEDQLISAESLPNIPRALDSTEDLFQTGNKLPIVSGYIMDDERLSKDCSNSSPLSQLFHSANSKSFAALKVMRKFPLLPVEGTYRLFVSSQIRDNLFEKVFVLSRWQKLTNSGLTAKKLLKFHAQHKLIIMSHADTRDLGQLLAELNKDNIEDITEQYISQLMITLTGVPRPSNHVNVLQHMQGHLKKHLTLEDKAELADLIVHYRNNQVPLMVPLMLLKHHFRKHPDPYVQEAYYMNRFPHELTLIDDVPYELS